MLKAILPSAVRVVLLSMFLTGTASVAAAAPTAAHVALSQTASGRAFIDTVGKINPGFKLGGEFTINCVKAAANLDDTLSGRPAVTLPGMAAHMDIKVDRLPALQAYVARHPDWRQRMRSESLAQAAVYLSGHEDKQFVSARSFDELATVLGKLGPGARAIVAGEWVRRGPATKFTPHEDGSHAFNAMNVNGHVVIADGQKGLVEVPADYLPERSWTSLRYMITVGGGETVLDTEAGRQAIGQAFDHNGTPPAHMAE